MSAAAGSGGRNDTIDPLLSRYSRQILFEKIGIEGQRRLLQSRVTLIGCGALGTVLANTLVRAGLGSLRICDRDFIERDNLQRQILFDESDVTANLPKAEAAVAKLRIINSTVELEAVVADVNPTNVARLCEGADLLLDGTDNFETRFLVNDLAVKTGRPWVYGAVVGATGLCLAVIPGVTPCLRCVFDEAPPPELNPTCDTAGVLAPAVNLVASLQAMEAMKLLMGRRDEVNRRLVQIDVWESRLVNLNVASAKNGNCPCCGRRNFAYLDGRMTSGTTTLCGRDAVQVNAGSAMTLSLSTLAEKLANVARGAVRVNRFMLKVEVEGHELTLFPDGRAIIKGTRDQNRAKSLYAKYIGA